MKAEVRHNISQNGIEIRFPGGNPGEEIISWLHSHRYRWARHRKNWYKTYSDSEFKVAQAKFEDSSDPTAPTPAPVPAKPQAPHGLITPLDQRTVLEQGGQPLQEMFKWAKMTISEFMTDRPRSVEFNGKNLPRVVLTRENIYEYLPPKRKRPDKYSILYIHALIQRHCLARGLIIPLSVIHGTSSSKQLSTLWDLQYHVREFPQQRFAPDYEQFEQAGQIKADETHIEAEKWKAIREKYFHVGQKVWMMNRDKAKVEQWEVSKLSITMHDTAGYRQDLISLQKQEMAWMIVAGDYPMTMLYLEDPALNPNAKLFTVPQESDKDEQLLIMEQEQAIALLFLLSTDLI